MTIYYIRMMNQNATEPRLTGLRCYDLLDEDEIRFAGIISKDGELLEGGFKPGLKPLEDDETKLKSFMEFVSKISLRTQYDESLGPINYMVARRDKVVLISFPFPLSRVVLLISAEPTVNIEDLAAKVVKVFGGSDLSLD